MAFATMGCGTTGHPGDPRRRPRALLTAPASRAVPTQARQLVAHTLWSVYGRFPHCPLHLIRGFQRLGGGRGILDAAPIGHFDVMDNHYVPNPTVGPMVCKALRNYGITAIRCPPR